MFFHKANPGTTAPINTVSFSGTGNKEDAATSQFCGGAVLATNLAPLWVPDILLVVLAILFSGNTEIENEIVEVLFKRCCRDGQVGNFVLQQLKAMSSEDVYEELVGRSIHEHVQMEDLPKDWWCNVVEGKWRRKRSLT